MSWLSNVMIRRQELTISRINAISLKAMEETVPRDTQKRGSPAAILAFAASSSRIIRVFLGAYTRIRPISMSLVYRYTRSRIVWLPIRRRLSVVVIKI